MPRNIFISHAGPDSPKALEVAGELEAHGLSVAIDREQLRVGDSFLKFMETALTNADYCLLLWSVAASKGKYVAVEWEAALYRTIEDSRRFLLIARLDEHPLPALLGPRLRVDLFPALRPGLDSLLEMCEGDAIAQQVSGRPVANGKAPLSEDQDGATIYLTSELFGLTQPMRVDLAAPSGVLLDRVVRDLSLPRQLSQGDVIGVRYEYRLICADKPLSRGQGLAAQGVAPGAVLSLEVEMIPFAKGQATSGALAGATFRGIESETSPLEDARRRLLAAVSRAGFGP